MKFPAAFSLSNEGNICYNRDDMRLGVSKQEKD